MTEKLYIHAIVIHQGGDLFKTLESITDCENIDILTRQKNDNELLTTIAQGCYYSVLTSEITWEQEINRLVNMTDSDFALIIQSGETVDRVLEKVEYYRLTLDKKIAMVRPQGYLNKLLVGTPAFRWLLGYGEQTIEYKLETQAINEGHPEYIIDWKDLDVQVDN